MYSDIIPPKKKYIHPHIDEYNSVRFSTSHQSHTSLREPRFKKTPIVLFVAACITVSLIGYHMISHKTIFTLTPQKTVFEIKQNIPLILQGREKKSLTYSLVYVPETIGDGLTRNPFTTPVASTSTTTASSQKDASIQIYASTTDQVKRITLINKTNAPVSLKKDTRFDVDGVVYMLEEAGQFSPTQKDVLNTLGSSTEVYKIMGFKGYATYDSVYAVPEISQSKSTTQNIAQTTTTSSTSDSVSTVPPKELLSLMPPRTLALQKSTIYDKIVDQSALVVFDQSALEEFFQSNVVQIQEYYQALKSFGESISYEIVIVDYTLNTSPDTGKPTSLASLTVEILPKIDESAIPLQFAGFSKETMNIIEKQVGSYLQLKTSYTPFWSKAVAKHEKIQVKVLSENQ